MNKGSGVSPLVTPTLLAASVLVVMCGTMVNAALPAIGGHFESEGGLLSADLMARLVLTVPSLAVAISSPFVGVIVDTWGRKAVLVISLAIASLIGASVFLVDRPMAIIGIRAVHGLGLAGIITASTALAADYFRGSQRTRFMGLQAGFMGYGAVAFLFFGGVLADIEWRMPFLVYLSGLLVIPFAVLSLRDPEMIAQTSRTRRMPARTWAMVALISGIVFFSMIVFITLPTQLPFHVKELTGASGTKSGMALAFSAIVGGTSSMCYSKVRARLGHAAIALLSFTAIGSGLMLVGLARGWGLVYAGLVISALGTGQILPNANVWVTAVAPKDCRGRALGMMATFMFLGQFVSTLLSQPVADRWGLAGSINAAAIASLVAALVGLPLLRLDRAKARE